MSMHKRITVLINKGQKRVERTQEFRILIIKKSKFFYISTLSCRDKLDY